MSLLYWTIIDIFMFLAEKQIAEKKQIAVQIANQTRASHLLH